MDSLLVSSLYSVINPYATYSTFQHGVGFAIIPFAIYLYLYLTNSKNYFIYTTIYGNSLKINLYIVDNFIKLKIVKTLLDFLEE